MTRDSIGAADSATPLRKANSLPFERCILSIVDAHDKFGMLAFKTKDEKLQRSFLLEAAALNEANTVCGADSAPIKRQATIFFQAVAMALEIQTGLRICSIVEMDEEGLGRAIIYCGRLVLISFGWRQGQFGFTSLDDACNEGERYIQEGIEWLEKYPDIARLGQE